MKNKKDEIVSKIKKIAKEFKKIKEESLENAFYSHLCTLIEIIANEELGLSIRAIQSPKKAKVKEATGFVADFPDIQIRTKDDFILGHIEVKLPSPSLKEDEKQFNKYKETLPNVVFTNINNWQLWQWDKKQKSQNVLTIKWDFIDNPEHYEDLKRFILLFLDIKPSGAQDPIILAKVLAKRNKLLREVVEEAYLNDCPQSLKMLFNTIKAFLIDDISPRLFANMYAETITYALFIARLQHHKEGEVGPFDRYYALKYLEDRLPQIPLLTDLYSKTRNPLLKIIGDRIELIIQELKICNIKKIEEAFLNHNADKDPVIYFYQPFVRYSDKEMAKKRGIFYTPKQIADFITRGINYILKNKYRLETGLADETVHLLDPATGTGTFLYSAIQEIYKDLEAKYFKLGKEFINQKMQVLIKELILCRFYGFEILMCPYAISHLKLSLLLEEYGYKFKKSDKENRIKVYLTNTLENKHLPTGELDSITKESNDALNIKNKAPVLVIMGNPPYSVSSQNKKSGWLNQLMESYKNLEEKTITSLSDDYVKFLRFAQWRIHETGQGMVAMITNNNFIDGITFREMRKQLLEEFDEIYICNLHGNLRKNEGDFGKDKDENVFNDRVQGTSIRQGVSINFFIKYPVRKKQLADVFYCDLYGKTEDKLSILEETNFNKLHWGKVNVEDFNFQFESTNWGKSIGPLNLFVPKSNPKTLREYGDFWSIKDIFSDIENNSGIETKMDRIAIQFNDKDIQQVYSDFTRLDVEVLRKKYEVALSEEKGWTIPSAKQDLLKHQKQYCDVSYRPFDIRKSIYTGEKGFIARPQKRIMANMLYLNIALSTKRFLQVGDNNFFVTKNIANRRLASKPGSIGGDYIFPLYKYDDGGKCLGHYFPEKFVADISKKNSLNFIQKGSGDLMKTFGPLDVFYYIYAIFCTPDYQKKYGELLMMDFPRIPLPSGKKTFKKFVACGKHLVNLHLLGKNPFDKEKTILDKPKKWIHIGSKGNWKLENIEYDSENERIYVNTDQYFGDVEKEVWGYLIGGYRVCEQWLTDRQKSGITLSQNEVESFIKIILAIKETIKLGKKLDTLFKENLKKKLKIRAKIISSRPALKKVKS